MATPDNNQSRKYTAIAILILGSLLLVTVIGILLILSMQRGAENHVVTETRESNGPIQPSPTPDDNNDIESDVEPNPTPTSTIHPGITTDSTEIIAPLLFFSRLIEPSETDRYLFQAAADVPLTVKLETNFDLRLNVQIVDQDGVTLYEEEFGRGQHEITFRVRQTAEYRIIVTGVTGRGEYIIGMMFANEPGIQI
jgi:hypothetical protein